MNKRGNIMMKRIPSFCVDHTKLEPGIYTSRIDGDIVTYEETKCASIFTVSVNAYN